jgi:hypothetical protein
MLIATEPALLHSDILDDRRNSSDLLGDEYAGGGEAATKTPVDSRNTLAEEPQSKRDTLHERPSKPKPRALEKSRFPLPWPLTIIPVRADGSPDWNHRVVGVRLDLTNEGELEMHWQNAPDLPTTALLGFVHAADGTPLVTGIEIESMVDRKDAGVRIRGRIGGFGNEILNPVNLTPALDKDSLTFSLGFPEPILDQWVAVGVLDRVLVDKVQVCPKCQGLPTFRRGCPNCSSARLENDSLIHHFACAHVGLVSDFESDGTLICPKCRVRHLVVAADFDYVKGPYQCLDCQWSNVEPEEVAQCLQCQFRFPAYQANTQELRGYRAHRLDILAYLPAS